MRRIIFTLTFLFLLSALGSAAYGQRYSSEGQCVQAMEDGTAIAYSPGANNLFKPIDPRTEVMTELEEDECQEQIIDRSKSMTDFYWVFVPKGTKMVKEKGGVTIKRRYSCGNPVRGRRQKKLATPTPTPATPSPTVMTTPPPVPMCVNEPTLSIERARALGLQVVDGRCFKPEPPKQADCPTCPKGAKGKSRASTKEKLTGGKRGAIISTIAGYLGYGASTGNWGGDAVVRGAVPSVLAQRTEQFLNPSHDILNIRGEGFTAFDVHKGEEYETQDGHWKVTWDGGTAYIYYDGKQCFSHDMKETENIAVIILPKSSENDNTAKKGQPNSPIRVGGNDTTVDDIPRDPRNPRGGGLPQRVW